MKSDDNSAALAPVGNWIIRKIAEKRGTEIPLAVRHTIDALWPNTIKPLILRETRTGYGWDFTITLPPGMCDEDFLSKEKYFYTAVGRKSIQLEIKGEAIFMYVCNSTLGTNYPYQWNWSAYDSVGLPLPIGFSVKGLVVKALENAPHMLIWGSTNSGKTNLLRVITLSLLQARQGTMILIIDIKETDFLAFENHALLVTDVEQAEQVLGLLNNELDKRKKILRKHRVENVQEFNKLNSQAWGIKIPYIVLIVDELAEVSESKVAMHLLDRLTRLGRYVGIQIIAASQRTDAKMADKMSSMKMNYPARICFYMPDSLNSRMIIESDKATRIQKVPGRGVLKWGNELTEFQCMNLKSKEAESILSAEVFRNERQVFNFAQQSPVRLPPRSTNN